MGNVYYKLYERFARKYLVEGFNCYSRPNKWYDEKELLRKEKKVVSSELISKVKTEESKDEIYHSFARGKNKLMSVVDSQKRRL